MEYELQPCMMTRAERAMEKLPTHIYTSVPEIHIMAEAVRICEESTKEYSMRGWYTWGHADEVNRLVKTLDDYIINNNK